ncbi:DUF6542 domain-containing protein [Kitasatospora sp. NPDC001660]
MAGKRGRTSSTQEAERPPGRAAAPARSAEPARTRPGGALLPAALAVVLPALGAGVDELSGPGMGFAFAAGAVLGTGLAAALSSRSGWWWVLCASPLLVLGVTAAAELAANGDAYKGKALATGSAKWVVHGFPVMAAAAGAAVLVIVVRVVLDRRKHHG